MKARNLRLIFDPLFRFAEAYAKVALSGNVDQRNVLALPVQNLLKKSMLLLVALFIFTSVTLKAQSPQKINFQSIVRNTNGVIFSNKTLSIKISLLSDSIIGTPVYSETHSSTTDAIGLVSLQIGSGTALSGSFATVNWGNAAHFIKLEADFNGGNNYVLLGTQELMSVPYAMYAAKTDTASLNLTNRFADKAPVNNPTFTGTVSGITKAMVGLSDVDNTADENKPVSTATQTALAAISSATQTALALKAPLANPTFTGTVLGIDKTMVDLGSVNNTSDEDKPVSSATQTALGLKAPLANPTFTGTVLGIDKTMVDLDRVDNTSDEDKPVSSLTQTALNLKLNISDFPSGNQDGEILYWSGGSWIKLAPGSRGKSIIIGNNGLPNWGCIITNSLDTTMSNLGQTLVVNTPITPIRIRTTGVTGIGYEELPQGLVASWSANVITITGTPTQAGTRDFRLSLNVSCGDGLFVNRSIYVRATVPNYVTGIVATAGDTSASVAFVAPTFNGGSEITGYTVTSNPGGITATGTTSPIKVSGLTNGTSYVFFVVATNAIGSSEALFGSSPVTPAPAATVPDAPTGVVATAGNTSASVAFVAPSNNGGSEIDGYRVTSNPGGFSALGATSPLNVTGLTNGTPYTFTVAAKNLVGPSIESAPSAAVTPAAPSACPTTTVEDRDGNEYNTVGIGTQCWMQENLKVTKYNNGDVIPDGTANSSWGQLTTGARSENVAVTGYVSDYGYLYNFYAATDSRKICPVGWHVPADSDWNKLVKHLDSDAIITSFELQSSTAGTLMKKSDALWSTNSGTNTSGFSALPGGQRFGNSFFHIRNKAMFWSAGESVRTLSNDNGGVNIFNVDKEFGASVRCLLTNY